MLEILKVRGIEKLSQEELLALCTVCEELSISPSWLACVISFETGGSFSPSQRNGWAAQEALRTGKPYAGAVGLIQFMPSTARALNTAPEALAQMTFTEQLVYVKKYLMSYRGRMKSLEDTYLAVFYPAAIGKEDGWVVANANGTVLSNKPTNTADEVKRAKAVYTQNAGFDSAKMGQVTRGMICSTIRAVRDRARNVCVQVQQPVEQQPVEIPTAPPVTTIDSKISPPSSPSIITSYLLKIIYSIYNKIK